MTPRPVDVGGQLFQLITLPAGTHHIRWEKENRKPAAVHAVPAADVADGRRIRVSSGDSSQLYAVEFEGRTVYTGTLPAELPGRHPGGIYRLRFAGEPDQYREFRLPERVPGSVAPVASPKRHPAQRNVVPADVKHQNVSISAGATYVSDWDDAFDLQRNQLPYIVGANPQALELKAGTSPRERGNFVSLYVNTCAGFELSGARQIELKLKNTFSDNPAQFKGHVMYNYRNPALDLRGSSSTTVSVENTHTVSPVPSAFIRTSCGIPFRRGAAAGCRIAHTIWGSLSMNAPNMCFRLILRVWRRKLGRHRVFQRRDQPFESEPSAGCEDSFFQPGGRREFSGTAGGKSRTAGYASSSEIALHAALPAETGAVRMAQLEQNHAAARPFHDEESRNPADLGISCLR